MWCNKSRVILILANPVWFGQRGSELILYDLMWFDVIQYNTTWSDQTYDMILPVLIEPDPIWSDLIHLIQSNPVLYILKTDQNVEKLKITV